MLDFYMPFILQECKNAYKGLEWEERVEVGKEALLYSIHTYNSRSERFPDYFLAQLKRILKQKNAEAWAAKRVESIISLDAPIIPGEDKSTFASCIGNTLSADTELDAKIFFSSLSQWEKRIIYLRMEGQNDSEILKKLQLSLAKFQSIMSDIQKKAERYFGLV